VRRPASPQETQLTRTVHRILIGLVVLSSGFLLVLWRSDNPRLERLRVTLADAVLPSMGWINGPLEFIDGISRDYRNFLDVYSQNRELRRQIQSLRGWRETARQLEEENAQLRALNNVRLAPGTTFVTGDVIADSGGPFLQSALVNVGLLDGVIDGAAAVDGNGLVGRVVGVGEHAARLLLLTDFSSRVPVLIEPSGLRAILAGDSTAAPRLEFVESPDEVKPGDIVRTSGDGGVYPPDLPVGRLIALPGGVWRVNLSSDFDRLEFVRLLRYIPDTRIDQPGGLILSRPRPAEAPVEGQPGDAAGGGGAGAAEPAPRPGG
jgi:rod shape-determining protein MreC